VIAYLLAMQLAAHVAAPYFTPYMLGPLGLTYERFTLLIAASFLARIAILPLLARVAQTRGSRFVLIAGAIGIVPLPPLWLVSHDFAYLVALQLVSGLAWAAMEYASLLSFFERIEERDRPSVLSLFNLGNAAALTIGSVLGGFLLGALGTGAVAYAWLFAASAALRLATLGLLRHAPRAETQATPLPKPAPVLLRTLAVRPASGAVQRPLLATPPRVVPGDAAAASAGSTPSPPP
jgi:predicted MFS family arabinose efflux permease